LSADWKAEREARSLSHLPVDVSAFRKVATALHAAELKMLCIIERAPEHRAEAYFLLKCARPIKH